MENKKLDMDDIAKALNEEDYCGAMMNIGFDLMFFDEDNYPNDFFFLGEKDELIVLFRSDIKEFWTYPRANHQKLKGQKVTIKPS